MSSPKGSPEYTGNAEYFRDKKVAFCSLASAGEVYFYSIGGNKVNAEIIKTPSHGMAIYALGNGRADLATVKNRVWNDLESLYPNLELVSEEIGKNPDNALISSKIADAELS